MTEHAKLSPSSAERWLTCTAAPGLEATMPPEEESEFALEGTLAHDIAAWLLEGNDLDDYEGDLVDDMDAVHEYVENVFDSVDQSHEAELYVEVKLDLSRWVPEGFGTADAVIVDSEAQHIIVRDLKFGVGVPVSAENNPQLWLYGLGALKTFGSGKAADWTVTVSIHQPRLNAYSEQDVNGKDLMEWGRTVVAPAAVAAFTGEGAVFAPSEAACRWCIAAPVCKALADQQLARAKEVFAPAKTPDKITPKQTAQILKMAPVFEKWLASVKAHAETQVLEGNLELEGFKIVRGRSHRKWEDAEVVEGLLEGQEGDFHTEPKLKSPAQIEKILGKGLFESLVGDKVIKPEGKPNLVPADDPRKGIDRAADAAAVFGN